MKWFLLCVLSLTPACEDKPLTKGEVWEDVSVAFCEAYYGRCGGGNVDPEGYEYCVQNTVMPACKLEGSCKEPTEATADELATCFEAIEVMACSDIYWGSLPTACESIY